MRAVCQCACMRKLISFTQSSAHIIRNALQVIPRVVRYGGGVRHYGQRAYHNDYRTDWDGRDGTRSPKDVLNFDAVHNTKKLHQSEKPVPLLEHLIKTYTAEGQTVLDFCMGSGSTGLAAVNTKRSFIGFELDTHFFDIAAKRISDAVKQKEAS